MKVRKPKVMCLVDNDGIGVRYIQPGFDYGRRDQDIVIPFDISKHDLFQLRAFHLAMCNHSFYIGTDPFNEGLHFGNVLYPVMNKKYLPPPVDLIIYCFTNYILI